MAVTLVGATLSMTARPAAAEIPTPWFTGYIMNGVPGDLPTCVSDLPVHGDYCNQQSSLVEWHVNQFLDGSLEFINVYTGNCLDDSPDYHLRTFPCNGGWGGYQKWKDPRGGELMNDATGLCLDYSGQYGLRTFGCNGGWGGYQNWQLYSLG